MPYRNDITNLMLDVNQERRFATESSNEYQQSRNMKTIKQGVIIGAFALLLVASAVHTSAIEGLQISVQCSNVVLRWQITSIAACHLPARL